MSQISAHRCLYEVLGVERSVDEASLRKAYKKQALKWHPDRNIDNSEEATARFKEINEAYEILSDKHERAWYDSHREQILRGVDPNAPEGREEEAWDLIPFFSPWAFSGFDDGNPASYYQVYGAVFAKIAKLDGRSEKKVPRLGNSKASFASIRKFYRFWEDFRSTRDFGWAQQYRLKEAPNRRVRRAMQRENSKAKADAKRRWEESVARLVAFVKRRDPRLRAFLVEEEQKRLQEERRQKEWQAQLDAAFRAQRKKARDEEIAKYMKEMSPSELESLQVESQEFECLVCGKVFKSHATLTSHEGTKKHKKRVESLREQLKHEEELLLAASDDPGDDVETSTSLAHLQSLLKDGQATDRSGGQATLATQGPEEEETHESLGGELEPEPDEKEAVEASKPIDTNEQIILDEMIAQRMAESEAEADESDDSDEPSKPDLQSAACVEDDKAIAVRSVRDTESQGSAKPELTPEDLDHLIALQMEQEEIESVCVAHDVAEKEKQDQDAEGDKELLAVSHEEIGKLIALGVRVEDVLDASGEIDPMKVKQAKRKARKRRRAQQRGKHATEEEEEREKRAKKKRHAGRDKDEIDRFMEQFQTVKTKHVSGKASNKKKSPDTDEKAKPKRRRRRRVNQLKAQHVEYHCNACALRFPSKNQLHKHLEEYRAHRLKINHSHKG